MKRAAIVGLVCLTAITAARTTWAQQSDGPTDPKAKKTYAAAQDWLQHHDIPSALESFKKADKQDGGRCKACQDQIVSLSLEMHDYKAAEAATLEKIAEAPAGDPKAVALAHDDRGRVLLREAMDKNKGDLYAEADKEYKAALAAYPNFPEAVYADGLVLAHLKQDDAARAQFLSFLALNKEDSAIHARAQRFADHPELVRARMAPPFVISTLDGRKISLDDLQGKVVLIDFWATWCGPCREALPHIREIAQKFQGQPLVILSVSLDSDDAKWKDFVAKNGMTWLQYRDGGFEGSLAQSFGVHAIPHTFTIDPDGVLQDEHIGDGSIEGKLKKLCAQARAAEESRQLAAKAGQ